MKRAFLLGFVLVASMAIWAQEKEYIPLEDIEQGWKTKTIDNVLNGSLGIMLERFDQTWPTWVVGTLRNTMEKGLDKEVLDEETGLTVTIDTKNGYAEVNDGGTDGEYMSACYWNRSNGHKLLAINMGKPTDPFIDFACFYDYDPQTKTLTPEPDILEGYRWSDREPNTQIFCKLPKQGKEVIVEEWTEDGPVHHVFAWDGMKPSFVGTEPYEYEWEKIPVKFEGEKPTIKDFLTALLSQDEVGEGFAGMMDAWEFYRNGMKLMPGDDLIVDTQNGYIGYESIEDETDRLVNECCMWNFTDPNRILVALSHSYFRNGKAIMGQYSGVQFYIFDKNTNIMTFAYAVDLGAEMDDIPEDAKGVAYALPRTGKSIVYTIYFEDKEKMEKRITWNGSKFVKE